MINGVVHPSPSTVPSLSGVSVATSDSFDISLPRSSILIIKIPPANPTAQLSYNGTDWPIPGTIEAEDYDAGGKFISYYDTSAGKIPYDCPAGLSDGAEGLGQRVAWSDTHRWVVSLRVIE